MKQGQRSRTAEGAAAIRARHLLYDDPVVFADPFAIDLTSPAWRMVCKSRVLDWLVVGKLMGALRPLGTQVVGRSRYAEDQLEKATAAGVDQYVLVGAGLDSFALRRKDLAPRLKVFELDHPTSQASKRRRLSELKIDLPDNLDLIPVDFERQSVGDALSASSYSPQRPAFFSWLGTVPYLSAEAIFGTLESIASFAAPGSEIVFDYGIPKELVDPVDWPMIEKLQRFTARRGELLVTRLDPRVFPQDVCALGFELVENVSPKEQEARYFADSGLRVWPSSYFAHFRVPR